MTAAVGDAARDDGDGDHDQQSRRDRETGLEKRVAPPLGKEEDEREEHGGEGDREYERRQVRETVCVIRKEAEIHGGRSGIAGAAGEDPKKERSPGEAGGGGRSEGGPAAPPRPPQGRQRHPRERADG